MAAINCKTYDTGEIVAEIRENRRYALASPSTVTGTPSLAMQSAAQMAVVYIYINDVKLSTPLTVSGTTKTPITINGANPSKEDLLSLSIEVTGITNGEVLYTTDEPNGSPSAPFANFAALPSPATVPFADAYIPALAGTGLIKMRNNGAEWEAERGTSPLFDLLDPIAVVAPGSTAPVPFVLATIPLGMWREASAYRYRFTLETAAGNTGSDTFTLAQNGVSLLSLPMVPGILYPVEMVFQRVGTSMHRRIIIFTSGVSTSNVGAFAVNFAVAQPVTMTITPANGANSTYLRYIELVRQ